MEDTVVERVIFRVITLRKKHGFSLRASQIHSNKHSPGQNSEHLNFQKRHGKIPFKEAFSLVKCSTTIGYFNEPCGKL